MKPLYALWIGLLRFVHCLFTGHEPVDGDVSLWCASCGMEWRRWPWRE